MTRHNFPSLSSRAPLTAVGVVAAAALVLSACGTDGATDDGTVSPGTVTTTVTAAEDEPTATAAETTTTAPNDEEPGTSTVTVTVPPETTSPTAQPPLGSPDLAQKRRSPEGDWRLAVVGVRVAEHERFDRVVFDLEGEGLPGWIIDYTREPRQQGSGLPIEYAGAIALQVGIDGTPYPFDVDPEPIELGPLPGAGQVTGVNFATIFEGRSEFVIGLEEQVPYSVSLLENPTRIVIDFAHD